MKRILVFFAFALFAICSCTKDNGTAINPNLAESASIVVSEVYEHYALVNIKISGPFGGGTVANGICVSEGTVPSYNDNRYPNLDNSCDYMVELTGLKSGTTYYISYYVVYYDGQVRYSIPVQFTTRVNDPPTIKAKLWWYNHWEYSDYVIIDDNFELPPYGFDVTSSIELKSIRVYVRENIDDLTENEYTVDEMDISGNYTFTYENQFSYSGKEIIGECKVFCVVENMLGNVSSSSIVIIVNHINSEI